MRLRWPVPAASPPTLPQNAARPEPPAKQNLRNRINSPSPRGTAMINWPSDQRCRRLLFGVCRACAAPGRCEPYPKQIPPSQCSSRACTRSRLSRTSNTKPVPGSTHHVAMPLSASSHTKCCNSPAHRPPGLDHQSRFGEGGAYLGPRAGATGPIVGVFVGSVRSRR